MMLSGAVLLGIILVVVSLALVLGHFLPLLLLNLSHHHHASPPKGSFGWPLIGETLAFLQPHASNTCGTFLEDHCRRYGKVFKSHLFCAPTIVSCDQELNHFILQNEERLFQCSYPKPIHAILGKSSMLVLLGQPHKRLRNLALSLLASAKSRPTYLHDINTIALSLISSFNSQAAHGKGKLLFCHEARKFAFNVIVKQVLGLSPGEAQAGAILDDFLTFMRGLVSFPLYIPGTPYANAIRARARISCTVKTIVEERRKNKNGEDISAKKKGDFLDVLLSNGELSEEERVSFVLDSLLGGYETTSLLISMTVYFLGKSPQFLQQLEREHQAIRAKKRIGESLNLEDYKKMEFTQQVISEALRCGNIVKFVHRKATKEIRFKEYVIPSGWKVLPVFSAIHLDPSLYGTHADLFDPSRWHLHLVLGTNQAACKKFTPFGGGPRLCPGSDLAKLEAAFFLHHFLLNYRWRIEGDDTPMAYPYIEFRRGLPIRIVPVC